MIEVSRGGGRGKREAPGRGHGKREAPGSGRGAGIWWLLFKLVTVLSALVVALYAVFALWVTPPKQADAPTPPAQAGVPPAAGEQQSGAAPEAPARTLTRREGVYTVFLAATDKGGSLTDTMMVVCYDVPNQKVGVVSIPRDTLVERESGNPRLVYGKGGLQGRIQDVSLMLGIPIDGYVKVDINGFIALVDYLGGVDFYVPCDMDYDDPYQDLSIHYTQGQYHLTGQQAMEVARFRKNNPDENGNSTGYADTGRTETQRKLLVALAKKALSLGSLTKINGFVEIFHTYVDTDLELKDMLYFASQGVKLDLSSGLETATLPGRGDAVYRSYTYCYEPDQAAVVELVNRILNPYNETMTAEDMVLGRGQGYMNG